MLMLSMIQLYIYQQKIHMKTNYRQDLNPPDDCLHLDHHHHEDQTWSNTGAGLQEKHDMKTIGAPDGPIQILLIFNVTEW